MSPQLACNSLDHAFCQAYRHAIHARLQVWLWLLLHFGMLAVLLVLCPDLRSALLTATTHLSTFTFTRQHLRQSLPLLSFCACAIAFLLLYRWLYASDPGFLHTDAQGPFEVQLATAGQGACAHCGCRPSVRCKHSKLSGQCVHKFDHSCWFLSTDIGDRTHGAFAIYMAAQTGWILWALFQLWPVGTACMTVRRQTLCDSTAAWQRTGAAIAFMWCSSALLPIAYLLVLHVYLLLTNQTTLEVLKGPRLGYMMQHFGGAQQQQKGYRLPVGFARLCWDEMRGRGPPKPFSKGLFGNATALWAESCPRQYGLQASQELAQL